MKTYSMSSVTRRTTKQAGTMVATMIVLPFGFFVVSGLVDILTQA